MPDRILSYGPAVFMFAALASACGDDGGYTLGAHGSIQVDPAEVDFIIDRVAPGATDEVVVTVTNIGTGDLGITSASIEITRADPSLEDAVAVVLPAAPPLVVPADLDAAHRLKVRYTRVDDEPRELSLVLHTTDPQNRV